MKKIICTTLTPSLSANRYKAPSGKEYIFNISSPTEISDAKDVEFFLNAGKGQLFKEVGVISKAKEKIAEAVGIKEKEEKFIKLDGNDVPNIKYKWTEKELMDLNKDQQTFMIRKLAGGQIVPKKEADRVKLIIELTSSLKN